jgi:hypothetical protein
MTQSRREQLEHLRVRLLTATETASARDLPALSRELRSVTAELEMILDPASASAADLIAARRAARLADLAGPLSAGRRSQPRRGGGATGAGSLRPR